MPPESTLRADARRNLERVLDAATSVFAEAGPEASIDDVARAAGVGHATVFRRFPTKDDLIFAVIERRVGEIHSLAKEAASADDAGAAFFDFVWKVAELNMSTPGLQRCVARCGEKPGVAEIERLGTTIVARAQRAGAVRRDLKPADVLALVRAALTAAPAAEWRAYLRVVLDGLRPSAASD
jgi:AcrR family transcriptional regulator